MPRCCLSLRLAATVTVYSQRPGPSGNYSEVNTRRRTAHSGGPGERRDTAQAGIAQAVTEDTNASSKTPSRCHVSRVPRDSDAMGASAWTSSSCGPSPARATTFCRCTSTRTFCPGACCWSRPSRPPPPRRRRASPSGRCSATWARAAQRARLGPRHALHQRLLDWPAVPCTRRWAPRSSTARRIIMTPPQGKRVNRTSAMTRTQTFNELQRGGEGGELREPLDNLTSHCRGRHRRREACRDSSQDVCWLVR